MNNFLKTRAEITESTKWLNDNGYISHPISCKDFELCEVTKALTDSDLLDMGADGSFVLHNAVIKGITGRKVGIDLAEVTGTNKADGAEYFVSDLCTTPFESESFDTITCLSVIEHQVSYSAFAQEVSRLLRPGGKCYLSFDFWPFPINTKGKMLYGLQWNIIHRLKLVELLAEMDNHFLNITYPIDYTIQDAVINDKYCSPFAGIAYTFGLLEFVKTTSIEKDK